ncbi:virulence factor TspB C-terminal domain-related protein [Neisseria cinerea]|uniref:virulence factor TspB C-terminal domain-related protein n=1 Tax=Neisseria cinerea TaxID=483 RepID=UPI000D3806AB|nr:virulence factor TspB C-terminal domain-related protein [Neisseria cinerea]
MNEPRNRIFNSSNSRNFCSVVVAAFGIQTVALADVAMPPPAQHQNASFPSEQALRNMGYNPDTGVWRVNSQNTGRAEVKSDGATITGSQPKTVTATGVHGEKAVINTKQTQSVNINRLETVAGGTLAGLTAAGGAIGSDFAASAYKSAKEGDWGGFARDAFGAVLEGLSKLDFTGLGGGINQFLDKTGIREGASAGQLNQASAKAAAAQAQAERAGDFRAAVANAAAAKAATAAASAEQQQLKNNQEQRKNEEEAKKRGMKKYQLIVEIDGKYQNYVFYSQYDLNIDGSQSTHTGNWGEFKSTIEIGLADSKPSKILVKTPSNRPVYVHYKSYKSSEELPDDLKGKISQNPVNVKPEDFMLNQQEVAGILNKMLKDQNTNHAELMKQLAKLGGVIDKATTAKSFAPATALSAPFTPEGSNVPQQTLFKLDDKGNVTATAIPRPDLKPNSSQAPARQSVAPAPTVGHNNVTPAPSGQTGEQTAPSAQQNRHETEAGGNPPENYDYEDFIIPERTIDLGKLKPVDAFATDGVCPSGVSVQMGVLGTIDFNYDEACRILRLLRPIIILATMITCSMMAYAAVKEL